MNSNPQTTNFISLQIKTADQAIKEADKFLEQGAKGERPFLATRWQKVNTMLLGGFHFGQTYFKLLQNTNIYGWVYLDPYLKI